MKRSFFLKTALISTVCLTTLPAMAAEDVESIVKDGRFFGEARYRCEYVDQDGPASITDNAKASTIRANVGFETGAYKNFQALIEAQFVGNIGANNFNDTVNGKTSYPVVADPDTAEINQVWLSYAGITDTMIKAGRHGINIDNQRFVGTVGWRQNDQTFDSLLVTNSSVPGLDLLYSHVWNINRVFGDDHPLGDLDTETHIAHAAYNLADWLTLTGYGYWLDIDLSTALSSKTYGARLTGSAPVNENWSFFYEAEAAIQSDHGNNTANYDEEYYHLSPGLKGRGWTFQLGYEELGGNGTNAFQTPLATLHAFNGWADKFLSTPASGLEDAYGKISYKVFGLHENIIDGTTLTAIYHDFDGDNSGDYGSELDLSLGKTFKLTDAGQPFKDVNVLIKYADYNAKDAPYTDTQKFWFQVGVKF